MDREKVIKGLECHKIDINHRINCTDCPYYVDDDNHIRCVNDLHDDAIALLKEQQLDIEALKNTIQGMVEGQCIIAGNKQHQIVRCKDCKFYFHCSHNGSEFHICEKTQWKQRTTPDWFCADGER